jgi:hypothetical protein
MFKVEITDGKNKGKVIDYDKYVTSRLIDTIVSINNVSTIKAKELLFEALSSNVIVDEILEQINFNLNK